MNQARQELFDHTVVKFKLSFLPVKKVPGAVEYDVNVEEEPVLI